MATAVKPQPRDILQTFNDSFPLLQKVYAVYEKSPSISADQENTLRRSVEMTTLEILELIVVAYRQWGDNKKETLISAMRKVDTMKVFIDCAAQTGLIDPAAAQELQSAIGNVGAMIGGWLKAVNAKNKEKHD